MPPRVSFAGRSRIWMLAFLILASGLLAVDIRSQEDGERQRRAKPEIASPPASEQEDKGGYRIGVNVDLVLMHVSVFDQANHFVSGLKKENFRVYEDGVQQEVTSFSREDVPVSMGIVIDRSGSMKGKIDQVIKAALAFIRASNPEDQVFLIAFDDEVELIQDFTNDIDEITDSLDNVSLMGGTALYDAVYLGVQKAQTGTKPKKAIVVISDGEDMDSYYKLEEVVTKVQEEDVQVFGVGFLTQRDGEGILGWFKKPPAELAQNALTLISEETGGKAFFPGKLTDIHTIVAEIAHELRSQYSIGYFSSNQARDGTFRRVKIELTGKGTENKRIRHRRGYYAPKS